MSDQEQSGPAEEPPVEGQPAPAEPQPEPPAPAPAEQRAKGMQEAQEVK